MSFDNNFANSIRDDIGIFDGLSRVKFVHKGESVPNFTTGTVRNNERYFYSDKCLFRSAMQRLSQSVKQITVRMESAQQDEFASYDIVAELTTDVFNENGDPVKLEVGECDEICEVDENQREIGPRYICSAFDHTTLQTRIRIGCRRLI